MRYDNNINSSKPPLFVLNIWAKGIIKNNVNVKLKKKLKKDEEKTEEEDKKEDNIKKYIYKFISFVKQYINTIYNHTQFYNKN